MDLENEGTERKRERKAELLDPWRDDLPGWAIIQEETERERWHHLHILTRTPTLTRMEGMRMDLCMYKHKNSPHLEQFPQSIAPEKDLFSFSKKYWVCSVIQLSLENASERSSSKYAENTQTHHPHILVSKHAWGSAAYISGTLTNDVLDACSI